MADRNSTQASGDPTQDVATVSFKERVVRSIIVGDLSRLSFLYQTGAIGAEDFVIAVRERLHAIESLLHNVQVRRRLADAEALSWSDTLHALGVETADQVEPTRCEVLCPDLLGSGAEGSEKARSGLYSSTKSPGSISLRKGHDEAPDARQRFEAEKSSQEIFPPQSRPDPALSGPAPFVRLPVTGGHETLVDPDVAEALRPRKLWASQRYVTMWARGRRMLLHHLVAGHPLRGEVDHINGDRFDNRRCNLRIVDHSCNMLNQHRRKVAGSGFRGVNAYRRR